MTIQTSVPASRRTPGNYFEFNVAAAQRGLTPLDLRIALVGIQGAGGSKAALTVNQVFSEADADAFFEAGSEMALMCRWAMKAARDYGKSAQLWAVGVAAPGGGVARAQKLAITGTATEANEVQIKIAGRLVRAAVAVGDTQEDVAAAVQLAIAALKPELPVTAVVNAINANEVDCTHVTAGENGNDVVYRVVKAPAGIAVASTQTTAGAGVVDVTAALDLLGDKDYDWVATGNHKAADVADLQAHLAEMFDAGTKRWRQTLMSETGTLATAQALATAAQSERQAVVSAESWPNTPAEISAYVGTILASEDDPALPFNDVELPSLYLPEPEDVPTGDEIEAGIGGGLLMLAVNEAQTRARIVRAVTTRTQLNAAPFYVLLDVTIPRSLYYTARQIEIKQKLAFPRAKKLNRTARAVRGLSLEVLGELEELEIVQNVEAHAGELVVETDPTNADRLNQAIPTSIVPPLNQIANVMNLIVE